MSYSSMRGSDYLLQENKIKAFYFRESIRERIVQRFNPGVEIVHVIAKKFNPVSRAEFNPGVENAPCNRSLNSQSQMRLTALYVQIYQISTFVL